MTSSDFAPGGVRRPRPFQIRRLGHTGINVNDVAAGLHFYRDLLGLAVSDTIDFAAHSPEHLRAKLAELPETVGWFLRHGTDHHAFVIFPRPAFSRLDVAGAERWPEQTVNQITWQVGSLREVVDASNWLSEGGIQMRRTGRDTPGSNWHTYLYDPDGAVNELYWGIEQVGWDGLSKPTSMYNRGFRQTPPLPQPSEAQEVLDAEKEGANVLAGHRWTDPAPATYDVEGIMLPRPFKVTGLGPMRMFCEDVERTQDFYCDKLGFSVSEHTTVRGLESVWLRCGTEHHALGLLPLARRSELGFSEHSRLASTGFQLGSYQQLRAAIPWLRERGVRFLELDDESAAGLSPGVDGSVTAIDPDGHGVQLWWSMEQIGWDGAVRPADQRRSWSADPEKWPEEIDALPDSGLGEQFLGPWT